MRHETSFLIHSLRNKVHTVVEIFLIIRICYWSLLLHIKITHPLYEYFWVKTDNLRANYEVIFWNIHVFHTIGKYFLYLQRVVNAYRTNKCNCLFRTWIYKKVWIRLQEDFFCFAHENLSTLFCCAKYQIATIFIQCMSCDHVVLQIGMKTVCSSENLTNTATLFANQK